MSHLALRQAHCIKSHRKEIVTIILLVLYPTSEPVPLSSARAGRVCSAWSSVQSSWRSSPLAQFCPRSAWDPWAWSGAARRRSPCWRVPQPTPPRVRRRPTLGCRCRRRLRAPLPSVAQRCLQLTVSYNEVYYWQKRFRELAHHSCTKHSIVAHLWRNSM